VVLKPLFGKEGEGEILKITDTPMFFQEHHVFKCFFVRKPEDFQANVLPFKSPLTPLFQRGALFTQFSEELHLEGSRIFLQFT